MSTRFPDGIWKRHVPLGGTCFFQVNSFDLMSHLSYNSWHPQDVGLQKPKEEVKCVL